MSANHQIAFGRILCPTDLSPESYEALRRAIALASVCRASLSVCHSLKSDSAVNVYQANRVKKQIEAAVRNHLLPADAAGIEWDVIVTAGEAADAIAREAAERRIDLIVMTSRWRPFGPTLLGSTTEAVCRIAPCPVMVTHPRRAGMDSPADGRTAFERVLVAYDFSTESELALAYGLTLAQEYRAELHLVHVLPRQGRAAAPELALMPSNVENALYRLDLAVPAGAGQQGSVIRAVRHGHPYREILAYAEENNLDLICMGASGADFGMQALFGSNADRVIRQAQCPVLIARLLKPKILAHTSHLSAVKENAR